MSRAADEDGVTKLDLAIATEFGALRVAAEYHKLLDCEALGLLLLLNEHGRRVRRAARRARETVVREAT